MARSHSLCRSLSWKEPSVKSSSSRQNPSKHRVLPSFSPSGHYQLSFLALILAFSQYLKSLDRYFSSNSPLPLQHLHYCISLHQSEFKTCLSSLSGCFLVILFVCQSVVLFVWMSDGLSLGFQVQSLLSSAPREYSDAKSTKILLKMASGLLCMQSFSLRNSSP